MLNQRYQCDGSQMDNLAQYIMNRRLNEERKLLGELNEQAIGVRSTGINHSNSNSRDTNRDNSTELPSISE